jgi:hypothetical protein
MSKFIGFFHIRRSRLTDSEKDKGRKQAPTALNYLKAQGVIDVVADLAEQKPTGHMRLYTLKSIEKVRRFFEKMRRAEAVKTNPDAAPSSMWLIAGDAAADPVELIKTRLLGKKDDRIWTLCLGGRLWAESFHFDEPKNLFNRSENFLNDQNYSGDFKATNLFKWVSASENWLKEQFREHLVSAAAHYDSGAPHILFLTICIDHQGRPIAKQIGGGQELYFTNLKQKYSKHLETNLDFAAAAVYSVDQQVRGVDYSLINEYLDVLNTLSDENTPSRWTKTLPPLAPLSWAIKPSDKSGEKSPIALSRFLRLTKRLREFFRKFQGLLPFSDQQATDEEFLESFERYFRKSYSEYFKIAYEKALREIAVVSSELEYEKANRQKLLEKLGQLPLTGESSGLTLYFPDKDLELQSVLEKLFNAQEKGIDLPGTSSEDTSSEGAYAGKMSSKKIGSEAALRDGLSPEGKGRIFQLGDGRRISVSGHHWTDLNTRFKGLGSLDLVIHLSGYRPAQIHKAGYDLEKKFGKAQAAMSWGFHQLHIQSAKNVKTKLATPYSLPQKAPDAWTEVRGKLISEKGVKGVFLDLHHRQGLIYGDKLGRAVFPCDKRSGCFLLTLHKADDDLWYPPAITSSPYVLPGSTAKAVLTDDPVSALKIKFDHFSSWVVAISDNMTISRISPYLANREVTAAGSSPLSQMRLEELLSEVSKKK